KSKISFTMPKDSFILNVNFNLRSAKPKNKPTAINCIIRYNKQRIVISRVEKTEPVNWNSKEQKPKYRVENTRAHESEENLSEIETAIRKKFSEYLNQHEKFPPVDEFKNTCE